MSFTDWISCLLNVKLNEGNFFCQERRSHQTGNTLCDVTLQLKTGSWGVEE